MKHIIIAGATGMIGNLILKNCIANSNVKEITVLSRKEIAVSSDKVKVVIIKNFNDYSTQNQLFENIDISFFCIGVYSGKVPDDKFKEITIDYAVAFANATKRNSP